MGARSMAFTQEGGVGPGHTQNQVIGQLGTEEHSAQTKHTPNMVPQ